MNTLKTNILSALADIEDTSLDAGFCVMESVCDSYGKALTILSESSVSDVSSFSIFQEADDKATPVTAGEHFRRTNEDGTKENIFKSILLFIGRLFTFVYKKLTGGIASGDGKKVSNKVRKNASESYSASEKSSLLKRLGIIVGTGTAITGALFATNTILKKHGKNLTIDGAKKVLLDLYKTNLTKVKEATGIEIAEVELPDPKNLINVSGDDKKQVSTCINFEKVEAFTKTIDAYYKKLNAIMDGENGVANLFKKEIFEGAKECAKAIKGCVVKKPVVIDITKAADSFDNMEKQLLDLSKTAKSINDKVSKYAAEKKDSTEKVDKGMDPAKIQKALATIAESLTVIHEIAKGTLFTYNVYMGNTKLVSMTVDSIMSQSPDKYNTPEAIPTEEIVAYINELGSNKTPEQMDAMLNNLLNGEAVAMSMAINGGEENNNNAEMPTNLTAKQLKKMKIRVFKRHKLKQADWNDIKKAETVGAVKEVLDKTGVPVPTTDEINAVSDDEADKPLPENVQQEQTTPAE